MLNLDLTKKKNQFALPYPPLRKKEGKDSKSSMNAYSRKGRVSKKQMPVTKKKKKKTRKKAYGKERKTKPQMLMANEKWLP